MTALFEDRPVFCALCVHLAVLGAVGGGLASSAHEWLLQRLAAVIAQRGIAALGLRPDHFTLLFVVNMKKRRKKKIPSRPGGGHGKPISFTVFKFASGGCHSWGYPQTPTSGLEWKTGVGQ